MRSISKDKLEMAWGRNWQDVDSAAFDLVSPVHNNISLRDYNFKLEFWGVVFLRVDILSTVGSIVDYLSAVHCALHCFYCHVTTIDKVLSHKVVDCHPIVIWAHLFFTSDKG